MSKVKSLFELSPDNCVDNLSVVYIHSNGPEYLDTELETYKTIVHYALLFNDKLVICGSNKTLAAH